MKTHSIGYTHLLHKDSLTKAQSYLQQLKAREIKAGKILQNTLSDIELENMDVTHFIECLLNTKKTQIFAESSVSGDGSDWNQSELAILGDIAIAMEVEVYDNGLHQLPAVHPNAFQALLIYTPGALLRNGTGNLPADWSEVVKDNLIDYPAYLALYERRLVPCLLHANQIAQDKGKKTVITIPGLGCGQFAGKFKGQLGEMLKHALMDIVTKHATRLSSVAAIYYDPFNECNNQRLEIEHISFLVRPLLDGNQGKGQLCQPSEYEDIDGEFADCMLTSLVAWDHVSWPGNDFYIGSRATDDGVKAAATNTITVMTGFQGQYNPQSFEYVPPSGYRTWDDVVAGNSIKLHCKDNLKVF